MLEVGVFPGEKSRVLLPAKQFLKYWYIISLSRKSI